MTSFSPSQDGQHQSGSTHHPNPMFDFLTGFVPRKLKDLFRWTEYLFYNSPHIFQALTKLSDYILTNVTIDTDADEVRKAYEVLFRLIRLMPTLKAVARDRMLYGNAFVSMHFPFNRFLVCSAAGCTIPVNIKHLKYQYDHVKRTFAWDCPECRCSQQSALGDARAVRDIRSMDKKRVNIIRWDPKLMDIDHNPITGESEYYYNIPPDIRAAVENGKSHIISHMPAGFLEACREGYNFKFGADGLYHLRIDAPAGVDVAWGFPPLTAMLKQFYYTQVLRKANEAIAMDHLVPFRVLHPAQTGQSNDPVTTISMANWVNQTQKNVKQWRRDPLHMMFSPVALGVTQMGGQGRTLMVLGEVKEAEDNILGGIGVPREFFHGGLSYTGSSITLRMLENQLQSHKVDIEDLLQWIADQCSVFFSLAKVKVSLVNFKFVDDIQQKSMELSANSQHQFLSRRSIAEMFERNIDEELEQITTEQLQDYKRNSKAERQLQELQTSLAQEAAAAATQGQGLTYDQQAVMGAAYQTATELAQLDDGLRRSRLHALQAEDGVMYAVVIQALEQLQTTQRAEMRAQSGV